MKKTRILFVSAAVIVMIIAAVLISRILSSGPSKNDDGFYEIGTKEDLIWLSETVNSGDGVINAVLVDDITFDGEDFTPIGSLTNHFNGVFDGQGHRISGIVIDAPSKDYMGVFGCSDGVIRNLTVNNYIVGNDHTGGVCGFNTGLIENCCNEGNVLGHDFVGGIYGNDDLKPNGRVRNCYNIGSTSAHASYGIGCKAESVENCYSMVSWNNYGISSTESKNCYCIKAGADKACTESDMNFFESGEATYLLNSGNEETVWYQNIDIGERDAFPTLDSTHGYVHSDNGTYTNKHTYKNGVCECGAKE